MPGLPTIYTARSDVDPAHLGRVEEWYARRHAPDLIRAGFLSAQVYYSEVGAPLVCNLYEIPGPELFLTQAYRDVAANDAEGPGVIALLTSRSNTVYDQVLTVSGPGPDRGAAAGPAGVAGPWLTTLRFDLPDGDEGRLLEWYEAREFPRLRGRPGFRAGRLCRRGPPHPTAPSHDPRWLAVAEWDGRAEALADGAASDATARHEAAFAGRLGRPAYNVGRRHFRLARRAG
jgi:hypothetical protein